MRRRFLLSGLLMSAYLVSVVPLTAGESGYGVGSPRESELRYRMIYAMDDAGDSMLPLQGVPAKNVKKPSVGILLSALVPGTGEMYAGSWLKGAVMVGAEAALWFGYAKYTQRGDEIEDEYHAFADTYWSREKWEEDYSSGHGETHTLPDTKTQQYYEMIGKYDQFMMGWDDWVEDGPDLTEHRDYYENLRNDSNIQFRRATTCVMLSMGNRLLSVFDTAFTIRRLNRAAQAGVRMSMDRINGEAVPTLALKITY